MVVISSKQPLQAEGTARRSSGSNNKRRTPVSASAGALVVSAVAGVVGCTGKQRREHGIMSVFTNSDLLEEIVETTEEQEADLCSGGETVDDLPGLPIGDYIEEPEQKHQPHLHHQPTQLHHQPTARSQSSSSSSSSKQKGSRSSGSQQGNVGLSNGTSTSRGSARYPMEQEKRMRREIANSNERRRMQSINAGFQSLRTLLPHHEGEKLSKAAILQQTAEYIYQLEQQKTQLLSQNLQLKRLVDQHEGGEVPTKKRKCDNQGVVVSLPVHVSESGDEGLGSMSPEPLSVITVSADGHASVASNEVAELKRQLERERLARAHLEKEMRAIQNQQIYPERFREEQIMTYQPHEVIEHTNNIIPPLVEDSSMPEELQLVSVVSVPTVGSTQTVETSNADSNTPPLSPQPGCEVIVPSNGGDSIKEVSVDELLQIESRPNSPKVVGFTGVQVFASALDDQTSSGSFSPGTVAYTTSLPVVSAAAVVGAADFKGTSAAQFITASPSRPFSPDLDSSQQQRLPSVLEAAIKAEPKVEVERLPSPSNSLDDGTPQTRLYLANTSRQNLETIVEAIRHLEGDHLFSDEPAQDVPLALTNKPSGSTVVKKQRILHADVNDFLLFHKTTTAPPQQQQQQQSTTTSSTSSNSATTAGATASVQATQQTQQRPGVIVVKHS
ncbi:uncharacterized protein LOC100679356 [Nasonia vitripennis]|uniref:BHLH domain-containing protein n=1 Tax=Nasonia vitripennis TaxID=7425 RepID=A0A7M7GCH3_NASVI|nr:uncharacterized protein LOC100679356 [Nasonia vitripennis]